MKRSLLTLLLGWWLAMTASAATPPGWQTNLTNALATAQQSNAPVLLYFTADWCGPCHELSTVTFADEGVRTRFQQFITVAVDLDSHQELAEQYSVSSIPCLLVLSPNGDELDRQVGYLPPTPFREWLQHGVGVFAAAQVREQVFFKQQAGIEHDLQAADSATRKFAVQQLLDFAGDHSASHQNYAVVRLKKLAVAQPRLVSEGLRHPLLGTRIQIANLLREQFGDRFTVDPWDDTPLREKSLAAWEAELSGARKKN